MIIFAQSYASPQPMSADEMVYKSICKQLEGNIKIIFIHDNKVRNLKKSEALKLGVKCYKIAQNGDIIFGWGGICVFLHGQEVYLAVRR